MSSRDYGLGNYTRYVIGRPRLVTVHNFPPDGSVLAEHECPNCHAREVCEVQVVLKGMPLLPTRYAVGTYLSCPACPWASPMVCMGVAALPDWWSA